MTWFLPLVTRVIAIPWSKVTVLVYIVKCSR